MPDITKCFNSSNSLHQSTFQAMASPCQVLIDAPKDTDLNRIFQQVAEEAWRIEQKYSRYLVGNIIDAINHHQKVQLDEETLALLTFANTCFEMSEGLFDVTSGVLRRIWSFKTLKRPPSQQQIDALLPLIGWKKACFEPPYFQLPPGMEIDLGGIGKEYAVDKCLDLASQLCPFPCLINFGGDLKANAPRRNGEAWVTGIEQTQIHEDLQILKLKFGAITTSGTARQHLEYDGVRYSHILNPQTGWPVINPPTSITIAAGNCLEAGLLSTLAMLHGEKAESFLASQDVDYWIGR